MHSCNLIFREQAPHTAETIMKIYMRVVTNVVLCILLLKASKAYSGYEEQKFASQEVRNSRKWWSGELTPSSKDLSPRRLFFMVDIMSMLVLMFDIYCQVRSVNIWEYSNIVKPFHLLTYKLSQVTGTRFHYKPMFVPPASHEHIDQTD
jgi:hypothetical protein